MRPGSAKAKGRRLQQRVVADLCEAFALAPDDVRSCPMGSHGEDVRLSSAAKRRIPWSIECKNQERLNLWAAFAQASATCAPGSVPVVVAKRNHEEPLCTMRWTDALALLQASQQPAPDPSFVDAAVAAKAAIAAAAAEATLLRQIADRLEKSATSFNNVPAGVRPAGVEGA